MAHPTILVQCVFAIYLPISHRYEFLRSDKITFMSKVAYQFDILRYFLICFIVTWNPTVFCQTCPKVSAADNFFSNFCSFLYIYIYHIPKKHLSCWILMSYIQLILDIDNIQFLHLHRPGLQPFSSQATAKSWGRPRIGYPWRIRISGCHMNGNIFTNKKHPVLLAYIYIYTIHTYGSYGLIDNSPTSNGTGSKPMILWCHCSFLVGQNIHNKQLNQMTPLWYHHLPRWNVQNYHQWMGSKGKSSPETMGFSQFFRSGVFRESVQNRIHWSGGLPKYGYPYDPFSRGDFPCSIFNIFTSHPAIRVPSKLMDTTWKFHHWIIGFSIDFDGETMTINNPLTIFH